MLVISDIQEDLGLTIYQTKALVSDESFNFPIWSMSKSCRVRKWSPSSYAHWKTTHWERVKPRFTLMGGIIKQKKGDTYSEEALMLVNWVRNCAHIERYTMRLAQVSASKALCKSYGVKSLLEIKL